MKKLFALLLAALLLLSCLPALGDGETGGAASAEPAAEAPDGEAAATPNEEGVYRVWVADAEGPVQGVVVQLCDEASCSFQKTDGEGLAVFQVEEQKVYEIHILKVPEGYAPDDGVYRTLETWSDVSILIERAE